MLKSFGIFMADVITLIMAIITALLIYEHFIKRDFTAVKKR